MKPLLAFSGQTILVTGASRGIGKAIARKFLDAGAHVLGTATDVDRADRHERLEMVTVDFSDEAQTTRFLNTIRSLETLDVVVNNAGINRIKPLASVTLDDYEAVLSIDLRAPYLVSQAAAGVMIPHGRGRIVNIASLWSIITKPGRTLYTTAKAGLAGMTRAMAAELAPSGILVNSVSPGFVDTDLTRSSLAKTERKHLTSQIPLGRMAEPEEIAEAVCFLSSRSNTYLTGQNIVVDGGFSII